jgi:ABC-type transporter Mla subunit MlaD
MAFFAGSVVAAVAGIAKLVDNVATLALDTETLSDRTGIAFERLVALREAAKQFRISPEQFEGALTQISKGLEDAKRGVGSLNQTYIDLKRSLRTANGELRSTEEVFFEIGQVLSQIEDKQTRIASFEQVFEGNGAALERLFRGGAENVQKIAEGFRELGEEQKKNLPVFDEYEKNLANLGTEFSNFTTEFVIAVSPAVTSTLQKINELLKQGREELGGGISGAVNAFARAGNDKLLNFFGFESFADEKAREQRDLEEFRNRVKSLQAGKAPTQSNQEINIKNEMAIEVPPGSSEEQQRVIRDSVNQLMQEQSEQMARKLLDNYPEVE